MDQLINYVNSVNYLAPLVFLAIGLISSAHCVGMCGTFSLICSQSKNGRVYYQIGRVLGYLVIGGLIGFFGKVFIHDYQGVISHIGFFGLVLFFLYMSIKVYFGKEFKFQFNFKMFPYLQKSYQAAVRGNKSFLIGLFSVFLPCGLLYMVFTAALLTSSWWLGMLSIFSFWLGTLPALVFAPHLIKKYLAPMAQKAPKMSGVIIFILLIFSITTRYQSVFREGTTDEVQSCH